MALLFLDSCDHYVTADLLTKWTTSSGSPAIVAGQGRRGSAALNLLANVNNVQRVVAASGSVATIGVAINVLTTTIQNTFLVISNGGVSQMGVHLNTDGTLGVSRAPNLGGGPGTILGTTAVGVSVGTYAFLEVQFTLHDTAGAVTLRLNGVSVLSLTAQDTNNGASNAWTTVGFAGRAASSSFYLDDLYVLDGAGSAPWTTFLGDCRVDARYPTGAGATTAWTPSTGANWSCVDETAPNGDTDYTASSTVGQTDTFVTQDAPVVGATIYGVQHCLSLKKMDAGTCTVAPVIRHSGTDYPGADLAPSTAYAYGLQIAQVNPGTGAAWTEAGFNAAEFGYKKTA